jgi:hypothetical protein
LHISIKKIPFAIAKGIQTKSTKNCACRLSRHLIY